MPDSLPAGLGAGSDPVGSAPSLNSLLTPSKEEEGLKQEALTTGREAEKALKSSAAQGTDLAKHLGEAPDPVKYGLSPDDLKSMQPEKSPEYKSDDPLKDFGSIASLIGIFGGMRSRTPLITSLNAAAGAMKAAHERNLEDYDQKVKEWKNNTDYISKLMEWREKAYDIADKKFGSDLAAKSAAYQMITSSSGDTMKADQVAKGNWQGVAQNREDSLKVLATLDATKAQLAAAAQSHRDTLQMQYDKGWKDVTIATKDGKTIIGEVNRFGATPSYRDDTGGDIDPKNVAGIAPMSAGGGLAGGFKAIYTNRILLSGNEAAKDLANVVQLPTTSSTGIFGGRQQGPDLLDAGRETLANTLTSQDVQLYNVMATGFQRSLATIEASGLRGTQGLSDQMNAVMLREGDTNLTKMAKLAQIRQIVEAGLEISSADPSVPPELKKKLDEIVGKVRDSVPYTQSDVIGLTKAQQVNPKVTLHDIMPKEKPTLDEFMAKAKPANPNVSDADLKSYYQKEYGGNANQ